MKTVRGDATEASEMGDAVMSTMTDRKFRRGIAAAMAVVACAWGSVSARASADGAAQAIPDDKRCVMEDAACLQKGRGGKRVRVKCKTGPPRFHYAGAQRQRQFFGVEYFVVLVVGG